MTQPTNQTSAGEVELNDCPPGLFMFGDTLGFKSEYMTTLENPRRYQCDAYAVESGEYFWGGTSTTADRGRLLVRPLENALLTADREGWTRCQGEAKAVADSAHIPNQPAVSSRTIARRIAEIPYTPPFHAAEPIETCGLAYEEPDAGEQA